MRKRPIPYATVSLRSVILVTLGSLASLAMAQPPTVQFRGLQLAPTGAASLALSPGGNSLTMSGSPAGADPFGLELSLTHAQGGGLGGFAFDDALPPLLVTFTANTAPALATAPELTLQWTGIQWTCAGDQSGAGSDMVDVDYWLGDVLVAARSTANVEPYAQTVTAPSAVAAEIAFALAGPGDLKGLLAWRIEFPSAVDCMLADGSQLLVDRVEIRPTIQPLMLTTKEMQEMNQSFTSSFVLPPFALSDAWMLARSHELRGVGQARIEAVLGETACDECVRISNLGLSGGDGVQTAFNPREYRLTKSVDWPSSTPVGSSIRVEAYGEVDGIGGLRVGSIDVEKTVGEKIMRPDFGVGVRFALELRLAGETVLSVPDHSGIVSLPEVGDEVLVGFEHEDPRTPYVLGRLYNGHDHPPGSMQPEGESAVLADELRIYPLGVAAPSVLQFLRLLSTQAQPLLLPALVGSVEGDSAAGWSDAHGLGSASLRRVANGLLLDPPMGAPSAGVRVELEPTNGWMVSAGNLAAPYIPGGAIVSAAVSRSSSSEQQWSSALRVDSSLRLQASANAGSLAAATLELWVWNNGAPVAGPIALSNDELALWLNELPLALRIHSNASAQRMFWNLRAGSIVELASASRLSADTIEFRAISSAKTGANELTALELHSTDFGPLLLHDLGAQNPIAVVPLSSPTLLASAWPNPIAGAAGWLSFSLPRASRVRVELFDLRGRQLATLLEQEFEAGTHNWEFQARDARRRRLAAGTYFLRTSAAGLSETTRIVLLR
jgi:hypothetical protein